MPTIVFQSLIFSVIPSLFSTNVLSAVSLSFPDLLFYLSKDAKAATVRGIELELTGTTSGLRS